MPSISRRVAKIGLLLIAGISLAYVSWRTQYHQFTIGVTSFIKSSHNSVAITEKKNQTKQSLSDGDEGEDPAINVRSRNYHEEETTQGVKRRSYSTQTIARAISQIAVDAHLLVYDPTQDIFIVFSVAPETSDQDMSIPACHRLSNELPLLVQALKTALPRRFQPHVSPLFQLFFTDTDITQTICGISCEKVWPWLHFGSFFRNSSIYPRVQTVPHFEYLGCIREWVMRFGNSSSTMNAEKGSCDTWKMPYREDLTWQQLTPKIIWRGSNYTFLPTLTREFFVDAYSVPYLPFSPRELAVQMSSNTNASWLDVKFPHWGPRGRYRMSVEEQSAFRYHIDLGGDGGTSWRGTLEKLAMPGLLFHHETPAQDWFYKDLVPWHHFVPVRTDLSNLKERFDWAEAHPDEARAISQNGTEFVKRLFSNKWMKQEYERHFGGPSLMGTLADSYESSNENESVDSVMSEYENVYNIRYARLATCTNEYCDVQDKIRRRTRHFQRNGTCVVVAGKHASLVGRPC